MRIALFISIVALALSGCAGSLSRTTSPDGSGATPGVDQPPAESGTAFGGSISPAVQALLEQSQEQRDAGEYSRASASLERALRIESGEPMVWLEMGWLRYDEGNYAQAEQMGRKALSLAPAKSDVGMQASQLIDEAQFGQGR